MDTVLNTREREVLKHRMGFQGTPTLTFREIGKIYGITGNRIKQIEDKALSKIGIEKHPYAKFK